MILGSFAGLSQQRIKRLLAYSSIGHVGYLLVAVCCGSIEGLQAVSFVFSYIYDYDNQPFLLSFWHHCAVLYSMALNELNIQLILVCWGRINPLLASALTLSMFSLAGIPPLAGFYGKAFLFWAALSSSQYFLAFVGIATSAISCFYYIRLVKIMYFEIPKGWLSFFAFCKQASFILTITFLVILCLMGYPAPLYLGSHNVALTLSL